MNLQLLRVIQLIQSGIQQVKTPGQMAYGKQKLEECRGFMEDLEHIHLFEGILENANLPTDLDEIDLSADHPDQYPWCQPPPPAHWENFMSGNDSISISQFMTDNLMSQINLTTPSTSDPGHLTADPGPSTAYQGPSTAYQGPSTAYTPQQDPPRTGFFGRILHPTQRYTPGTDALGPRHRPRR